MILDFHASLGLATTVRKRLSALLDTVRKWSDASREAALEARRMHTHMSEQPGWKQAGGGYSTGGKFTDYQPDTGDSPHHVYVYNEGAKKAGSYEYHNFDRQESDASSQARRRGDGLNHLKHTLQSVRVFA